MQKLNYKRTFFIGLAFLSISAFWQMYDNIIPLILKNTFGMGETITGVVMAIDNVLALFLLPVIGSFSDRVDTRWGKRMPFIVGGTLMAVIFMMIQPYADRQKNQFLFIAVLFCTLLAMGLYRSPAVALMPDLTPNEHRSRANAIINLMGAVGGVYALIMIKVLVGEENHPNYFPLYFSIGILMVLCILILVLTISEKEIKVNKECDQSNQGLEEKTPIKVPIRKEGSDIKLEPDIKRSMIFMLLSIFFWFAAYNAVTTAFSRYTSVVWGMEGGAFANCLMVATVAAIISYVPISSIAGRIGRKKTIMGGVLLMAVCYGAAFFISSYHPIINVAFALIGVAWAAINVNSYPMIVAMGAESDIGRFTGTYYTFSMSAQIVTPILSGMLLERVSYRTLFPYAFLFTLLAFVTMTQVKHGDVKPMKKESILEHYDVED
ncbi:MFS transporter [Lachnospiraceae bacterium OttesenSCG-928-D06]|nr:MFS transporter [Lachnospiraceae bacterium OttesenSCG-928-D06]